MRESSRQSMQTFLVRNGMVLLFEAVSLRFKLDEEFRKLIKNEDSTFNQTIAFSTGHGNDPDPIDLHVVFCDGKMDVRRGPADDADLVIFFKDKDVIKDLSKSPASEWSQPFEVDPLRPSETDPPWASLSMRPTFRFAVSASSRVQPAEG